MTRDKRRPDTTGRKINGAYADLVTAQRQADRRAWLDRRASTLVPASPVRRIDPRQYFAEKRAARDAANSAHNQQSTNDKPAPQAHNAKCHDDK